jgi:hypothetical protein
MVIPVNQIMQVEMVNLNQSLPEHIWDGIEE